MESRLRELDCSVGARVCISARSEMVCSKSDFLTEDLRCLLAHNFAKESLVVGFMEVSAVRGRRPPSVGVCNEAAGSDLRRESKAKVDLA